MLHQIYGTFKDEHPHSKTSRQWDKVHLIGTTASYVPIFVYAMALQLAWNVSRLAFVKSHSTQPATTYTTRSKSCWLVYTQKYESRHKIAVSDANVRITPGTLRTYQAHSPCSSSQSTRKFQVNSF